MQGPSEFSPDVVRNDSKLYLRTQCLAVSRLEYIAENLDNFSTHPVIVLITPFLIFTEKILSIFLSRSECSVANEAMS